MYKEKNKLKGFAVVFIIILLLASGLFMYNKQLQEKLSTTVCITLEEIMRQQKFNFHSKLMAEDKAIRTFALLIDDINKNESELIESLKFIKKNSAFERVAFIRNDNEAIFDSGHRHNFGQKNFLLRTRSGETVVSELIRSVLDPSVDFVLFASPVFNHNKEIIGTLVGAYASQQLDKLFLSSFSNQGLAYVTDANGEIIARTLNAYASSSSNNFFDILKNSDFYEHDNFDTIMSRISNDDHGHSKYNYHGNKFFLHYTAIGVNDWKLFSVAPEQVFMESRYSIFTSAIFLTILLVLLIGGQGLYVYKVQQSYIKDLYKAAFLDELTGASNFQKFKLDAEKLLLGNINSASNYTIIKLDVDRFKLINNIYGHEMGDKILNIIVSSLKSILDSRHDTFSRINSDEFLILMRSHYPEELDVARVAFEKSVKDQVGVIVDFKMTMPEGRYDIPKTETNIASIFEKVNFAHRLAKHSDSKACYYNDQIKAVAIQEKELENKMESALLNGEFHMFLQPKYRLEDEQIIGAEVLSRWKVQDTFISPAVFIPLFEQNGFITRLDLYMFEEACKNLRKWIDAGIETVTISVNFSRLHLTNKKFVEQLAALADKYSLPHNLLEIEITETAIFDNIKILSDVLDNLHLHDFTLSMDDFGSGYSSLGLLKNLSVDVVKIDRGFFDGSTNINREKAVIAGVITMAQSLNIITVAEGVETKVHIDLLKELKCDIVQGYYYSKPLPLEVFEQKLLQGPVGKKYLE